MKSANNTHSGTPGPQWHGYSFAELQARRRAVDKELAANKQMLTQSTADYTSPRRLASSIMNNVMSALTFFDYASIAFAIFRRVRRLFGK